jgi:hypothetical protein
MKRNIKIYLTKYTLMLRTDFIRLTQRIVGGCFEHYKVQFRYNTRELGRVEYIVNVSSP